MAATGTVRQVYNGSKALVTTIVGVVDAAESEIFSMKDYKHSSFTLYGTFGGTSAQWQGSNDGNNWTNIGAAMLVATGGTLTPDQTFYAMYQLVNTGGAGADLGATIVAN